MMNNKLQERATELQIKAAFGDELTLAEHKELDRLAEYLEDPATDSQVDYIEVLLGKLGADLSDYTATELDELTGSEASDLIDELKDDVTDADAWEN